MKKTLLIILVMMIMGIPFVFSLDIICTNTTFDEPFNYSDDFSSHGWNYFNGACGASDENSTPVLGTFDGNAFGVNAQPTGCGFPHARYVRQNIGVEHHEGTAIFYANVTTLIDSTTLTTPVTLELTRLVNTFTDMVIYVNNNGGNRIWVDNFISGGQDCNVSIGYPVPNTLEVVVELDLDNLLYSLYVNGNSSGCTDKIITNDPNWYLGGLWLRQGIDTTENFRGYIDDVFICEGTVDAVASNFTCFDSDGNYSIFEKGTVTLYEDAVFSDSFTDYCYDSETLREGITTGCESGLISFVQVDCNGTCFNGTCAENQRPVIHDFTTYREEIGAFGDKHNHVWYAQDDILWVEVNTTDYDGDPIYTAINCDINNGSEGISNFGPQNSNNTQHNNCTFSQVGNYTSRVYVTDDQHTWGDFETFEEFNFSIRECVNFHDCPTGYLCGSGSCFIPGNVTNCTDSDGGIDENVTGWVETPWENITDSCFSATYVNELACDPSDPSGYSTYIISCGGYGPDWICWQGECTNETNTSTLNLFVRDYDTNLPLSGIDFWFVQIPSYSVVFNGTVSNGQQALAIQLGFSYQVPLEDSTQAYKDWTEWVWTPGDTGTDLIALMERHCIGSCVYNEYFSYVDSPRHHGWKGANHSTHYDGTLGFVGNINLFDTLSHWYTTFPSPTEQYTEIIYEITMANETPADGQDLSVYIEEDDGDDIFVMRYVIDEASENHIYYFTTSWNEIPLATGYLSTTPVATRLIYDRVNGKMDIYIDSLNTDNYVLYVDGVSVIDALDIGRISFDPATPTYYRDIYVDNIELQQLSYNPSDFSEDDPTNPDIDDLPDVWFRDANGDLKFDSTYCDEKGYRSYIWCAITSWLSIRVSTMVAWIFTGIHILYLIVILVLIVLIGPLVVELLRPRR